MPSPKPPDDEVPAAPVPAVPVPAVPDDETPAMPASSAEETVPAPPQAERAVRMAAMIVFLMRFNICLVFLQSGATGW
jgi:hypothetical protein